MLHGIIYTSLWNGVLLHRYLALVAGLGAGADYVSVYICLISSQKNKLKRKGIFIMIREKLDAVALGGGGGWGGGQRVGIRGSITCILHIPLEPRVCHKQQLDL